MWTQTGQGRRQSKPNLGKSEMLGKNRSVRLTVLASTETRIPQLSILGRAYSVCMDIRQPGSASQGPLLLS